MLNCSLAFLDPCYTNTIVDKKGDGGREKESLHGDLFAAVSTPDNMTVSLVYQSPSNGKRTEMKNSTLQQQEHHIIQKSEIELNNMQGMTCNF